MLDVKMNPENKTVEITFSMDATIKELHEAAYHVHRLLSMRLMEKGVARYEMLSSYGSYVWTKPE